MAATLFSVLLVSLGVLAISRTVASYTPTPPKISPATGLKNNLYTWKSDQKIRYLANGPEDGPPVVLVHGLFVNADHWRKSLDFLGKEGYRVYALDLWGCGYSSKPPRDSDVAQAMNGEQGRFRSREDAVLKGVPLGSANGKDVRMRDVDQLHPLGSPYNFFTWSELITDFSRDVVKSTKDQPATLVSNSIGTISSLQAVLDKPELYRGVFVVAPNFRELHSGEVPLPFVSMPLIRTIQKWLRESGKPLFDSLATPSTVKRILMEPYAIDSAVDDTLVDVLLSPLLTKGASDVVFDTLSYSAGPLPEIQLGNFPSDKPVWVCYGDMDPWTPGPRVEALVQKPTVERVVSLPGVGHCPHDEAPELVHPLLMEYLQRVCQDSKDGETCLP